MSSRTTFDTDTINSEDTFSEYSNPDSDSEGSECYSCTHAGKNEEGPTSIPETITTSLTIASSVEKSYFHLQNNLIENGLSRESNLYEYNSDPIQIQLNGLIMHNSELLYVYITKLFGVSKPLSATILFGKLWDYPEIIVMISGLGLLRQLFANQAQLQIVIDAEMRGWGKSLMKWETKRLKVSNDGKAQTQLRIENSYLASVKNTFPCLPSLIVTIEAFWIFSPTASLRSYFSSLSKAIISDEIRELEGTVLVITRDGKRLKFPRGILAACSPVFLHQFKNAIFIKREAEDDRDLKDIMEIEIRGGADANLQSVSVKALLEFLTCFSVCEAMKNSDVTVELLMAGHFYEIKELELAMIKILLAQPSEWFNMQSLVNLYWYAGEVKELVIDSEKNFEEWRPWEMLQIKALWNLKRMTRKELEECNIVQKLFPTKASLNALVHFISHI